MHLPTRLITALVVVLLAATGALVPVLTRQDPTLVDVAPFLAVMLTVAMASLRTHLDTHDPRGDTEG